MAGSSVGQTFEFPSTIRGYHVYKDIWTPILGEGLVCSIEENNREDRHAVALLKESEIVGHVPRENSKVFKFFLKRGGQINATVTGKRINVGIGLEIPAVYTFHSSNEKDIKALKTLLK